MVDKIKPFPVKLSPEGREAIRELVKQCAAIDIHITESDVVREALFLYFKARGKDIEFSPGRWGVRKDSKRGQE